jgi:predicted ATP-dependent endonuclease of OLD family
MQNEAMVTLKRVTVKKFKCFESDQSFDVDPKITVLVGMNESGKTAVLEAIAKTNYFTSDDEYKFNETQDYPRKEWKSIKGAKAGSSGILVG